jgi:hypothetical protein
MYVIVRVFGQADSESRRADTEVGGAVESFESGHIAYRKNDSIWSTMDEW